MSTVAYQSTLKQVIGACTHCSCTSRQQQRYSRAAVSAVHCSAVKVHGVALMELMDFVHLLKGAPAKVCLQQMGAHTLTLQLSKPGMW